MDKHQYQLISIELCVSILSFIIGVGILTIPRTLAQELNTPDGWISLGISGIMIMFLISLYTRLQRHFVGKNLLQYLGEGTIGKYGAKVLAILFVIFYISLCSFEARILSIVVKMYLLDQTPSEVIVAAILLLTTYAVHKGVQGVIHLNLLFMPIILFVILGVITFNFKDFGIEPLKPVLSEGIRPVLQTLKYTLLSYLGVEAIFFFMAYSKKSELRALPLNMTIGLITLIYMLVTIFSYSILSLDATKFITFPTIELAKEIEIPGAFIERLESLMMTVWIMTIFNTMTMCHFLAYLIAKEELFSSKKKSTHSGPLLLPSIIQFIIFIIAFIPNSITESFTFSDWIGWLGGALFVSGIFFGYLSLWVRKSKAKRKKSSLKG